MTFEILFTPFYLIFCILLLLDLHLSCLSDFPSFSLPVVLYDSFTRRYVLINRRKDTQRSLTLFDLILDSEHFLLCYGFKTLLSLNYFWYGAFKSTGENVNFKLNQLFRKDLKFFIQLSIFGIFHKVILSVIIIFHLEFLFKTTIFERINHLWKWFFVYRL